MKRTLTALTVAATMFASSASALDPADLQKLKDTGNCEECDLRDAYLASADLRDADLTSANLRNAGLTGANLTGAYLRDAKLNYAIMNGAILCNTTMPDGSVIYSGC